MKNLITISDDKSTINSERQTQVTNITIDNEVSLDDISDGFECENRRYQRLLEI